MPRWFVLLIAGAVMFGAIAGRPAIAAAHILEADNGISAELHIKPDDKPIAGEPINYVLSFESGESDFALQNCDCSIDFIRGDTTVASRQLAATTATRSDNVVILNNSGDYVFHVTGKPKNGASFKPFTLHYTERIAKPAASQASFSPILIAGVVAGAGLLVGVGNFVGRRRKR